MVTPLGSFCNKSVDQHWIIFHFGLDEIKLQQVLLHLPAPYVNINDLWCHKELRKKLLRSIINIDKQETGQKEVICNNTARITLWSLQKSRT